MELPKDVGRGIPAQDWPRLSQDGTSWYSKKEALNTRVRNPKHLLQMDKKNFNILVTGSEKNDVVLRYVCKVGVGLWSLRGH